MNRVIAWMGYLASFVSARGMLFAAPLLLASSLPTADYAQLEWALATATLAAAVLTVGTGGLVPLVVVGTATAGLTRRGILVHHLAAAAFCCALLPLCLWRPGWAMVLALTVALVFVSLASTELKSRGLVNRSLLLDALMLTAMAGLAWLASLWPERSVPGIWVVPTVIAACIGLQVVSSVRFDHGASVRAEWRQALVQGFPLMVAGALATLVTTSGRAGAGMLLTTEDAAAYAVLSRGAALPIVAHQILTVAVYRKLYIVEASTLNRLLLAIVGGVFLAAAALWLLLHWLDWTLGPAFADARRTHGVVLVLLLAQASLWSAIALNDLLNVRHACAAKVLRWSLPAMMIILPAALGLFHLSDHGLVAFAWLHSSAMLLYYLAQTAAMVAQGVRLPALPIAAVSGFFLLAALGLLA
jgi:hypothetical protein